MKHLKLFEAYIKDVIKSFDIDGYKVNVSDCTDVPGHKAIYTVEEYLPNGLGSYPVCFSDVELAKDYIKGLIERNEVNDEVKGFLIRKMMLDLVSPVESTKLRDGMDLVKDFPNFLESNLNPIANSYSKILKSNTLSPDKLTSSLKEMIRTYKTGDMNRINVFCSNFVKMIRPIYSENNKKSWDLTSDGRKWKSVIDQFETTVGLRETAGGPIVEY
jgi:hypothetical protein